MYKNYSDFIDYCTNMIIYWTFSCIDAKFRIICIAFFEKYNQAISSYHQTLLWDLEYFLDLVSF